MLRIMKFQPGRKTTMCEGSDSNLDGQHAGAMHVLWKLMMMMMMMMMWLLLHRHSFVPSLDLLAPSFILIEGANLVSQNSEHFWSSSNM